jgi:NADH-quinone oxidoreductase subunit K
MPMIPIWWYLVVAAALFSIGLFCALARRNAVNVLMGIELMLNAVNLNLVTFWRYRSPAVLGVLPGSDQALPYIAGIDGQAFAVFVIALAAAEAAVGLAMVIAVFRSRRVVELEALDTLRG